VLDRRLDIIVPRNGQTPSQGIERNGLENHDVLSRSNATALFEEKSDEDKKDFRDSSNLIAEP